MPRKPTVKKIDDPSPVDSAEDTGADSPDSQLVREFGDDQALDVDDRIRELFSDLNSDDRVTVALYRREPSMYQGRNATGFCEDLPPVLDQSYQQYIKDKYGGEVYQATLRVKGRFRQNVLIRIPGVPPRFPAVDDSGQSEAKEGGPSLPANETVEGVSIGGTEREFEARLARYVTINRILNPAPSDNINSVLLQHILDSKQGKPLLEQVGDIAGVLAALKELIPTPSGDGDGGFVSLIGKALDTLPQLIAQQRAENMAGMVPEPPGLPPGAVAVPQLENNTKEPEKRSPTMPPQATLKEKVLYASQVMLDGFLCETKPETIVRRLDLELELTNTDRKKVAPFRDVIHSQVMSLFRAVAEQDDNLGTATTLAALEKYFDRVFEEYVREGRVAEVLS